MPRSPSVPSYRLHKPSGQAVVTVRTADGGRRDVYLGVYNSSDSQREYARIVAELAAPQIATATRSCNAETAHNPTIDEVLLTFWRYAEQHYRDPEGNPSSEVGEMKWAIKLLREFYGHTPAAEFGPKSLATVRQRMVASGWCRNLINRRIDRIKRVFKWATAEELVPVSVYQALRTLAGLQQGRTEAPESKPVLPVSPAHVNATLPRLSRHVRVMVELQRLTGMRPCEVCRLTLAQVDRSGELWEYRPKQHKTRHRGKERVILFGPKTRALVTAFLRGDRQPPEGFESIDLTDNTARLVAADAYQEAERERDALLLRDLEKPVVLVAGCVVDPTAALFSPKESREERYRSMRANRKSPVQPSQECRRSKNPKRIPRLAYTARTYAHAVNMAAKKAGASHWHPNQLRHLFATEVRKVHGLEAAQVLLGHSRADVTQVYAERNHTLAAKIAAEIG